MNVKTYPFGILDYPDLFIMVIAGMAILMFLDDYLILGVIESLYLIYIVSMRTGKPMGYDRHFIKSKLLPTFLRPGQVEWRNDFYDESMSISKKKKANNDA